MVCRKDGAGPIKAGPPYWIHQMQEFHREGPGRHGFPILLCEQEAMLVLSRDSMLVG